MNRFVAMLFVLFSTTALLAGEKVWNCHTVESGGLFWEEGHWVVSKYVDQKVIIKQFADRLEFPKSMTFYSPLSFTCRHPFEYSTPEIVGCTDYTKTFLLNTKTGKATLGDIVGWLKQEPGTDVVLPMRVSAFQCESF